MASKREQELLRLKKLLGEVNALREKTGQGILDEKGLGRGAKSISGLNAQLNILKSLVSEVEDGFGGIGDIIEDIGKSLGAADDKVKQFKGSYSKLQSIAQNFKRDNLKIDEMDYKQVQKNIKQIRDQIALQKDLYDKLVKREKEMASLIEKADGKKKKALEEELKQIQIIIDEREKGIKIEQELLRKARLRLNQEKQIQNTMGFTAAIVSEIAGTFSRMGIHASFFDQVKEDMREAAKSGSKLNVALAGAKGVLKGVGKGLADPGVQMGLLKSLFNYLKDAAEFFRKQEGAAAKVFEVPGMGGVVRGAEDMFHFTEELIQAQAILQDGVGKTLNFNKQNAREAFDLSHFYGLANDEVGRLYQNSVMLGIEFTNLKGEVFDSRVEFEQTTGFATDQKAVMKSIAGSSATTRFNMRGQKDAMLKTANYATLLRLDMEKMRDAAEGTLNFEDSIEKEMQAELMLGKDINLEAYRYAALTGDQAKQAEELNRLISTHGKDLHGNVLLQNQFAAALGISRDELMNAVEGQDQQKKLGEDMASEQKRINKYVKEGKTIAEATALAKKDSTEGVIKSAQAAEEITRALEMVKRSLMEAMMPLAQKIFSTKNIQAFVKFAKKAISFLGKVVEIIANNFEIILMALVAWKGFQMIRGIKNMIFGERGSNMMNPVYTYNVNESGGGGLDFGKRLLGGRMKGNVFKYLTGGRKGGVARTINRGFIKMFGKNKFTKFMQTKVFNPLGKSSLGLGKVTDLFAKNISTSGYNLQKTFGTNNMSKITKNILSGFDNLSASQLKLTNKLINKGMLNADLVFKSSLKNNKTAQTILQNADDAFIKRIDPKAIKTAKTTAKGTDVATDVANAANVTLKATNTSAKTSKSLLNTVKTTLKTGATTVGKVLPVLDVALGGGFGYYEATNQSDQYDPVTGEKTYDDYVRDDMSGGEGIFYGITTGGANTGSVLSDVVGIERGTAADEALGVGTAAASGALTGAGIGAALTAWLGPGAAIGGAVGGVIGGVVGAGSELFKLFSDPNSNFRQGLNNAWEATKDFASNAGSTIAGWASSAGSAISGWASDAWSGISNFASSAGETLKGWATSAGETISGWASGAKEWLSGAASSVGDFFSNAWSAAGDFFSDVGQGAKDMFNSAVDTVGNLADNVLDFGKDAYNSISSTVSDMYSGSLLESGVEGAKSVVSDIGSGISSGVDAVGDFLGLWGNGGTMGGVGKSNVRMYANGGNILGSIGNAFSNYLSPLKSIGSMIMNSPIGGAISSVGSGIMSAGRAIGRGMGIVGERGPELVTGPARIYSNSATQAMANSANAGAGMAEVVNAIERLIAVVGAGGDVVIDGAKVGKAVALATSQLGT